MINREENEMSFTFEIAYFGLKDNIVSQDNLVELGKCFAKALKRYISEHESNIPLNNR